MNKYRKWIDLGLGFAALAVWFLLRKMLQQLWTALRGPILEDFPVQGPDLIAALLALVLFFLIRRNQRIYNYLNDVTLELAKVTWPSKEETVASTGVIIVMVGLASLILFGFDTLWGTLTQSLLN